MDVEDRLVNLERQLASLVEVCMAVADDTLRVCCVLDELRQAGVLPSLPWDVATTLVELHHAQQAQQRGDQDANGESLAARVDALKQEVSSLRAAYQQNTSVPRRPDETQPAG